MATEKITSVWVQDCPSKLTKRKESMAEFEGEVSSSFEEEHKNPRKKMRFSEEYSQIPFHSQEHELDFLFANLDYDCENPTEFARRINDILLGIEKPYLEKMVHQHFRKRIPNILSFLLQHHHEEAPLQEQVFHAAYYIKSGISLLDLYRFIKSQRLTIQCEVENFPFLDKVILQEERLESAVDHKFGHFRNSYQDTKSLLLSLNIWSI